MSTTFSRVGKDGKSHTIHRKKENAYFDKDLNRWVFPDGHVEDQLDTIARAVHPVEEYDVTKFITDQTEHITGEITDLLKNLEEFKQSSPTKAEEQAVVQALKKYKEKVHKLDQFKWNDLQDFDGGKHSKLQF